MEQTRATFQVVGKMVSNPRFGVAIFEPSDTEFRQSTFNDVVYVEGGYYRLVANHRGNFSLCFCTPEVHAYYSEFMCDVQIALGRLWGKLTLQNSGEDALISLFLAPLPQFDGLPIEAYYQEG